MALTIRFQGGPRAGDVLRFGDDVETILLGRDAQRCQVVFPPEQNVVGREHCGLARRLGRYRLQVNRDNVVLVDGRPAIDDQELSAETELQLGRGGPRLIVQTDRDGILPATEQQGGQPGKASLIRGAQSSARRGRWVALAALAVAVVLGIVGVNALRQTDATISELKTLSGEHGKEVQTLAGKFTQVEQQVADLEPKLRDALDAARPSVYLVLSRYPDGGERPVATAWVLDQDAGVMATNAHVAEEFHLLPAGAQLVVRSTAEEPRDFIIDSVTIHPGYQAFQDLWTEYEPAARGPQASLESVYSAGGGCDVALMHVTDAAGLAPGLPLADEAELDKLAPGYPIGYVGFPMEGLALGGVTIDHPTPATHMAYVTAATDFVGVGTGDLSERLLIQHALPVTGGASGSPILNERGQVVGVVNAMNVIGWDQSSGARIGSSANINFGQRADLLRELAADAAAVPDRTAAWRRQLEAHYVRRPAEEQKQLQSDALAWVRQEWKARTLGGLLGDVVSTDLGTFTGKVPSADDPLGFASHHIAVQEAGPHLFVVTGEQGAAVAVEVRLIAKGEILAVHSGAGNYRWLAAAAAEVPQNVELDIRVAGSQPGAAYQVSVYRGQVETLSAAQAVDRRVEEWRQQVENESGGPVAPALIDQRADATPPSDQRGSLSYEVYLPAGGEYLVVAVAEGGQDVDVVVGANLLEGYVQLAQDQLVSPLAAGWFELGDGGSIQVSVVGPPEGAPFEMRVYRAE